MSRALFSVMALSIVLSGCDKIPFIGGGEEAEQPEQTQAEQAAQAADGAPDMAEPEPEPQQTAPPPPPRQPSVGAQPAAVGMDEPWNPTMTGTISPGMTRDEVVATWGEPITERTAGVWTYLYYRNGCEVSCGTFDVVFLEDGQVVDAIVRGAGHDYDGVSSSPPGQPAEFTPPPGSTTSSES